MAEKLSFPAMRNRTVLIVWKRVYPRAFRFAAWNNPLMASMKPLVWRVWAQAMMPSKCLRIMAATSFMGSTLDRMTLLHPLSEHAGYDIDLLAIEDVAQLFAIEPCTRR